MPIPSAAPQDTALAVAIIGASAAWLTLLFAALLVYLNRATLRRVLTRTTKVSLGGMELEFATEELRHSKDRRVAVAVSRRLRDRADALAGVTAGMRVLWVDDKPWGNAAERGFLRAAGVTVVNELSSAAGLAAYQSDDWDLVITNFLRDGDPAAGIAFAQAAHQLRPAVAFVGYVGTAHQPPPEGFVAVVDKPEDLIDHVLDIAEHR